MMKKISLYVTTSLILAASTANAATLTCSGQIVQLNYHANNGFLLQLSNMNTPVYFCNPSATWTVAGTGYVTKPEECRALLSMFLAGKLAEKTLSVVYFDGDEVPASCSSWTSWSHANIRFFTWAD